MDLVVFLLLYVCISSAVAIIVCTLVIRYMLRSANKKRDLRIASLILNSSYMHLWDRMDAALDYFALGGNHNCESTVVTMIMQASNSKEAVKMWYDKVSKFKRQLPKEPIVFIDNSLAAIKQQLN